MRRAAAVIAGIALLGIGLSAAVAFGSGSAVRDTTTAANTTTTSQAAPAKVWLCHHTGSWKHPYHLIHVSSHAVAAHRRHGDVDPGAGNSCPTTQPAGTVKRDNGQSNAKQKTDKSKPDKDDATDSD